MAVYGVIADIHGNREALAAALEALERRGVESLACLGDIVGYNADPDECVEAVRSRCAVAIAGNHDLIGIGRLDFSRCSNKAAHSLKRTRRALAPQSVAFLAGLPASRMLEDGVVLVHGGVRDVQQYMITPAHIRQNAEFLRADFPGARICFFGHTHEQKVYEVDGEDVRELRAATLVTLRRDLLYFINPGSLDASRKRSHRLAELAVLDTAALRIEFMRMPYDAAATEVKAAAFGYRITPFTDRLYSLQRRFASAARRLGVGTR